nr:MAG TPA: hypothetical protein [Bacteriophage sp.]
MRTDLNCQPLNLYSALYPLDLSYTFLIILVLLYSLI